MLRSKLQKNSKRLPGIIVVAAIAIVGVVWLVGSHAASPYASVEAESGTLANGAMTLNNDPNASGDGYVQFGSSSGQTWSCTFNEPAGSVGSYTYPGGGCPDYSDTVNFTGPGLTPDENVGPDIVGSLGGGDMCINSSGTPVGVNDASCAHHITEVVQANSAQQWQVTANVPTYPGGQGVVLYPNDWEKGFWSAGTVLDNLTSLTSSVNVSIPNASNLSTHAMQDDWMNMPGVTGQFANDYEIMIQYDRVNDYGCSNTLADTGNGGTSWNWGVVATTTFGGVPYFLCDGQTENNRSATGGCTTGACGAVVWKPAQPSCSGNTCTDSNALDNSCNGVVPATSPCSDTFNLLAMFQWLETHAAPSTTTARNGTLVDPTVAQVTASPSSYPGWGTYPYIEPASTIQALTNGYEILGTGGISETLSQSQFTAHAQ